MGNSLFRGLWMIFGATNTIYQGRSILSSRNKGNEVCGSIKNRGTGGLLIRTIITPRSCSDIKTLACVTLPQSTQAMKASVTFNGTNMLGHDGFAHPNLPTVKEMIWMSHYGMKPFEKQARRNCTIVRTKRTKLLSKESLIVHSEDVTVHTDISEPMETTKYGRIKYLRH